jgi:hypothetical protein
MHAETIQIAPTPATARPRCSLRELITPTYGDSFAGIGRGWFLVLSRRRPETLGSTATATGPRNATMWLYLVEPRRRVVRPLTGIASTEPHRVFAWSSDGERALLECPFADRTLVTEIDLRTGALLHRVVVSDSATVTYAFPSEAALLVDNEGDLRVVYLNGSSDIVIAEDLPVVHHRRLRPLGPPASAAAAPCSVSRLFPLDLRISAVTHPGRGR